MLKLPLHCYDEAGRITPPATFWLCCLLLAKSYFLFIVSLSLRQDSQLLLSTFYPDKYELYRGFGIGIGAVIAAGLVSLRERWWETKWSGLRHTIKPLLFIALLLDLVYQVQHANRLHWGFSWSIAGLILLDVSLFYWVWKSRHLKWMIQDWAITVSR